MKKLVLVLTLAISLPALTAEPVPMSEFCPKIAQLSRSVMTARQAGVPMQKAMESASSSVTVSMVTEAYGHPAYSTQENQDKAIQEFEDRWYLKCIKSYNQ